MLIVFKVDADSINQIVLFELYFNMIDNFKIGKHRCYHVIFLRLNSEFKLLFDFSLSKTGSFYYLHLSLLYL